MDRDETISPVHINYATKQGCGIILSMNEHQDHSELGSDHSALTSDHTVLTSDVMHPISFCASDDGETVLITLEDPVISDQEISITDSSVAAEDDSHDPLYQHHNSGRDVLLVTTGNEHHRLQMEEGHGEEKVNISQSWFTSKTDKQTLQEHGHRWKQGQWTAEENEILKHNISVYCQEKEITDPNSIIFDMTKDMRKDFYRAIATGLNRPLFSVYRRVVRMYDQKNHMGKYTPEEISRLRNLREVHGNDWATIGAALGRSAGSVRDRCRLMKGSCKYGTWQHDEEMKLANAVYELSGAKPGQEVHHGLSWADVAAKVKTRTDKQCRAKWLNFLNWKQKGGAEWSAVRDDSLLLEKILASEVIDESKIDWVDLSKGWSCVRSPQWLRSKWWALKRHVTNYQTLPFNEILSALAQRRVMVNNTNCDNSLSCATSLHSSLVENSKLTSAGATTFRLFSSADGYKLTPTVQLADGTTAVLSDELSLDSSSLFITSSFPLSSLNEPLIVQALPMCDSTTSSSIKPGHNSASSLRNSEDDGHHEEHLGHGISQSEDDIVVLLGDGVAGAPSLSQDPSILVSNGSTMSKASLRHLSCLADPLLNSQSADMVTDN